MKKKKKKILFARFEMRKKFRFLAEKKALTKYDEYKLN